MEEISNVVRLRHPDDIDDPLTNVLRAGARRLLVQAVDLEVEAFLADLKDLKSWVIKSQRASRASMLKVALA